MSLVKRDYKNLNTLFDDFFNTLPTVWGKELNVPPVNIHETNDAYHVEMAAPGLKKEDFKINVENGMLTVSYEKKTESESKDYKTHRREYSISSFSRSFTLDDNINADGIQAKYEDGVLKLLLPKKEEVKVTPKEITIQ